MNNNEIRSIDQAVELNNYGIKCFHDGYYLQANNYFSKAIGLNPQFLSAFYNRAYCRKILNTDFIEDISRWINLLHKQGVMFFDRFVDTS